VVEWNNLSWISQSVDKSEMALAIQLHFSTVDADKDGKINRDEFQELMTTIEDANYFNQFEVDDDHYITQEQIMQNVELVAQMTEVSPSTVETKMEENFSKVDIDGDGRINAKEFGELMTTIWASPYFCQFDCDSNNRVSYFELIRKHEVVAKVTEMTEADQGKVTESIGKHFLKVAASWDDTIDEAQFGRLMMCNVADSYFKKFDTCDDNSLTLAEVLSGSYHVAEWNNLTWTEA